MLGRIKCWIKHCFNEAHSNIHDAHGALYDVRDALTQALGPSRLRRRRLRIVSAGLGLALLLYFLASAQRVDKPLNPPPIADLQATSAQPPKTTNRQRRVQDNSNNFESKLRLANALYAKGKPHRALRVYDKLLEQNAAKVDPQLMRNLIASFGTKAQTQAAALINKHKLTAIEKELRRRLRHQRRSIRIKALRMLEKLGKATQANRVDFYIQDLQAKDCDIRFWAATKLGDLGQKRAIPALQAADRKDKRQTPWYQVTCLGDEVNNVVAKIRKRHH